MCEREGERLIERQRKKGVIVCVCVSVLVCLYVCLFVFVCISWGVCV